MKAPETAESRARVLEIAKHLFHMLATVVPSAMQGRHAAFNPADFAIVSFSDQPISLANAFEAPIEREHNSGFLAPSIRKLADYWQRLNSAYALDERAAAFALDGQERAGLNTFARLPEIEAWIASDGRG
jgi:CRISPR system Cascade subunit CasC